MRFMVLLIALLASSPALARWTKATSDHFVVYGDMRPDKLREFVERIEKFDFILRKINRIGPEAENKLTIFAVPGVGAVGKAFGKGSQNVWGFYHYFGRSCDGGLESGSWQ